MNQTSLNSIHNKYAPYWAATLALMLIAGLSTLWFELGTFASGYLVDMVGPAWTYILFRGLYTAKADNVWTRFFTPGRTMILLTTACFVIEFLQYLKLYSSTFDAWDLIAYVSILTPLYLIDTRLLRQAKSALHTKQS